MRRYWEKRRRDVHKGSDVLENDPCDSFFTDQEEEVDEADEEKQHKGVEQHLDHLRRMLYAKAANPEARRTHAHLWFATQA